MEVSVITEKPDDLPMMKKIRLSLKTFRKSDKDEDQRS